ncbi:MAG: helix-turn-helix domain-containing protein, partial [bacterium]|nr:helix-turn-helix domain-containing protein [bacterium]
EKKIIKTLKPHLSGKVNNVYEDTAGNILAAAEKGLILLESGNIEAKNAIVYLRDIFVTGIYEDVTTLEESGGVYWVATRDQGLKRISKKDGTPVTYDAAAGLTAGSISRIFEDWRGFLWIMSRNNGILRINKAELNRYAGGELNRIHCRAYGLTDGLLSLEFNNEYSRSCAIKTAKGELVYLTKEGVAVVNPEKVPINQTPPGVVIEEILFDREQHPLNFGTVGYTLRGKKDFTVRFTAPTFLSPRKVVFKYRLEGVDKTEIHLPAGSERVVRYAGLESGEYKFRVTACNEEGVWNPTGVFVYFTLEPFYYQTLLFKLFVLLSVGVLLVAYYLYKKKYKTTAAKEEDSGLKEKPEEKEKYKGFHLEDAYAEECIKKLMKEVKIKKVYRDSKLTLEKLADKLSIPRHLLSRIINERLERNFSDFINYYRIEEAKTILSDPKNEKKKSSSIAFEVGFNTTAAFYNAFRKFTGTTPKEYRKEVLKKE